MIARRKNGSGSNPSWGRSSRKDNAALSLEWLEPRMMLAGAVGPVATPAEIAPISDPFAFHAVTYEQMVKRTATFDYLPGELMVAIQLPAAADAAPAQLSSLNWSEIVGVPQTEVLRTLFTVDRASGTSVSLVQLDLGDDTNVIPVMARLATRPEIMWSAPNFSEQGVDRREFEPNDPQFPSQWHHSTMVNDFAWDFTQGAGIKIGITDDGFDLPHEDLQQNIWVNAGEVAGNGLDDDANGYVDDVNGWDFITGNNDPNPNSASNNHGTHVAGIAAARTNNAIGVAGTAGQATIMPLQFYDLTLGWNAAEIAAAYTYGANNGAKIVSTSYNVDGWVGDPTFTAGLQYMYDQGVMHFNSAGNNGALNPPRQAFEQSLLVASTEVGDVLSGFTNYGTGIDLAAPGGNILSTLPGNTYDYFSGTSMATPNAAAAAALVWAKNPGWTREQVAAQLLGWAANIDSANPAFVGLYGAGRVNSFFAVANLPAGLGAPKVVSLDGIPTGSVGTSTPINSFGVQYSQIMNAASVMNVANYELRGSGSDGIFDTGDDDLYAISNINNYMVGTNFLRFNIGGGPLGIGDYRFRIISGGAESAFGTDLDGDGNNTAGGNFQRFFTITINDFAPIGIPGNFASVSPNNPGSLFGGGEIDSYALFAQAGEKLSVVVTPAAPTVTLQARFAGASGWVAAPAAGQPVVVPPSLIAASGSLDLEISGDGATTYTFSVYRNVNVGGLDDTGGVVAIDDALISLGSGSYAALGSAAGSTGGVSFNHYNNPSLFVDISATGTALNLTDDSEATIVTTVGNGLFPAGSITVANNGGILGEPGEDLSTANTALPNTSWIRALLPLWDDIDSDTGNVYWQETTVNGIDTLIVQWHNRPRFSNIGAATFQLQVFETGPIAVRFAYPDVDFGNATYDYGANATIGVQESTTVAHQFSLNQAVLANGSVIDIGFGVPTLDVDEYSLDLSGQVGTSLDVVLSGIGTSFAGQLVELVDPSNAVVATAVGGASNFQQGILDYVVADSGVHKIRVSSNIAGQYSLLVTEDLVYDTESNNAIGGNRSLDNVSGALGRLAGGTVSFDHYNNPGLFVDISGSGTPLNLSDDGAATISTTVGNGLLSPGSVTVGNNGALVSGPATVGFTNTALPNAAWGQALLPFWDDIHDTAGNVYWQEQQVNGIDALIVQWDDRPHYNNVGNGTFQVQLFASGPVAARFAYADVVFGDAGFDFGASATIGAQLSSSSGFQFSLDTAVLADGDVIDVNVIEQDIYAITLAAGDTLTLETSTPLDDPLHPLTNGLDPRLTVFDGLGTPLAADSDSAADGKNALLDFVAPAAGVYYIAVGNDGGSGDYVVHQSVVSGEVRIAAGVVTNVTGNWQTVTLAETFNDPIVIVGPAGSNDLDPGVVRIRNVTGGSFEIQLKEWDYLDGAHANESVSYLVMERGVNVLDNGAVLIAGSVQADSDFSSHTFGSAFVGTPIVLTTMASLNGAETVVPRLNNVSGTGFDLRVQEEEAADGVHVAETVNFLALLPGQGSSNGLTYQATLQTQVTNKAFPKRFTQTFVTPPRILAAMQTYEDDDTSGVRIRNLTAKQVSLAIDEEQSLDAERAHARETVGFVAFRFVSPLTAGTGGSSDRLASDQGSPATVTAAVPVDDKSSPTDRATIVAALPQSSVRTAVQISVDPRSAVENRAVLSATTSLTDGVQGESAAPAGWFEVDSTPVRSGKWYW